MMKNQNKTKPTSVTIDDFLASIDEKRQAEAQILIAMMSEISGENPVMWGPSIVGFGSEHYKSEAGREGDMPHLAFSPRKASLTIYFSEGFDRYGEYLARLGKHKYSISCLYINKLDDIDLEVLRQMLVISSSVRDQKKIGSVEEYVASVPVQARPKFDELRELVRKQLPRANEVFSYGIIGYKIDDKRARVFVSGWKDHVAMYPIPKNPKLQKELKPYIKGKGTLWFKLDEPLPRKLIERVVENLTL